MILKDNFYTVKSQYISGDKAGFRVELNAGNFIYQAHFPNNPITPGVCLIQMAVELFGSLKGRDFNIRRLKNVKFTASINPLEFPEVNFMFEFAQNETDWLLKVMIKENETVFAKISMVLA